MSRRCEEIMSNMTLVSYRKILRDLCYENVIKPYVIKIIEHPKIC